MFVGCIGVITFGLSILTKKTNQESHNEVEDLVV